jgi:hypothetical protein
MSRVLALSLCLLWVGGCGVLVSPADENTARLMETLMVQDQQEIFALEQELVAMRPNCPSYKR